MTRSSPRCAPWAYIAPFRLRQFALLAGLAATLVGTAPAAMAQPGPQTRSDVHYGPLPQQVGDLHFPVTPAPPGGRPAVLLIHGGGWVEGTRGPVNWLGGQIAVMGAVAFNIDYRLADAARPSTRWPAQLADARRALGYLRAHAHELGIDPARIGAMGDSAGAHLALLLGEPPAPVRAVVDQYGPTDLASLPAWRHGPFRAMFGTPSPSRAVLAAASPLTGITHRSPPTYIIQGDADETVPPIQSARLQAALHAAAVPVRTITYHGDHAYAGVASEQAIAMQLAAAQWLVDTLDGKPTP